MNDKRGLSQVITILIAIVLVLVAVGIIWAVLSGQFSSVSREIRLGKLTTVLDVVEESVFFNQEDKILSFALTRKPGGEDVIGFKVVIEGTLNEVTASYVYESDDSFDELETKNYEIYLDGKLDTIYKFSVIPTFEAETSEEVIEANPQEYILSESQGGSGGGGDGTSPPGIPPSDENGGNEVELLCIPNCEAQGYECGNHDDGCGGTCFGSCSSGEFCVDYECIAEDPDGLTNPYGGNIYYIDPFNSDGSGTVNDINDPYDNLYDIKFLVKAGDIVYLRGGLYNASEQYYWTFQSSSGNATHPITIKSYPGETASFYGRGNNGAIFYIGWSSFPNQAHYVIEDITFNNTGTSDAQNILIKYGSHNITVRGCSFYNHTGGNTIKLGNVSDVLIENNYFNGVGSPADTGSSEAIWLDGSHRNLIQNNNFTRIGHYAITLTKNFASTLFAHHNIVRNNTIDQHWGGGISTTLGAHNNVIENNIIYNVGKEVAYPKTGIQINTPNNIIRKNIISVDEEGVNQSSGISLTSYVFWGYFQNSTNNSVYNNVIYNVPNNPIGFNQKDTTSNINNKILNNILYGRTGLSDAYFYPSMMSFELYHASEGYKWTELANNNTIYNNLIMFANETGDYENFDSLIYFDQWANPWLDSLSYVETNYPDAFWDNIEQNPLFVDPSAKNFNLQETSPAVNAGAFLTTTTAAGSSTNVIPVEDAYFFTDGFGLVEGDYVRVGSNSAVKIMNLSYENNELHLNAKIDFSEGDSVSLDYLGSAPDIGAYENY